MGRLDQDKDGVISFPEFHALFSQAFSMTMNRDLSGKHRESERCDTGRRFERHFDEEVRLIGKAVKG